MAYEGWADGDEASWRGREREGGGSRAEKLRRSEGMRRESHRRVGPGCWKRAEVRRVWPGVTWGCATRRYSEGWRCRGSALVRAEEKREVLGRGEVE